jgi:hypothetical protein
MMMVAHNNGVTLSQEAAHPIPPAASGCSFSLGSVEAGWFSYSDVDELLPSRRRCTDQERGTVGHVGVQSALTGSLIEMAILEPNSWLITRIVTWIETITPSCEDITHLLSQSMDRRLLLHQRVLYLDPSHNLRSVRT